MLGYSENRVLKKIGGTTLLEGLMACWELDETSGTTVVDKVGVYDGINNGAVINQTGKLNESYDFDGVNDYLTMGNVLDFEQTDSFSISTWVKVSSYDFQAIIGKMGASGTYRGWLLNLRSASTWTNQRCVQFMLRSDNTTSNMLNVIGSKPVAQNLWCHIIVVYDGSQDASGVAMYVDGVMETNFNVLNNTLDGTTLNSYEFNIGSREAGVNWFFDGSIDQTAIWNRTLTEQEIFDLNNNNNGRAYSEF